MPIPEFVREIRTLVGTRYLLLPSVTAVILDERDRLLVVRVAGRQEERWILPGGLIEPDERPLDALVREVREETGLEVIPGPFVGVFGGPEFRVTHASGDETGCVMNVFRCTVVGGSLRPDDDEVAELRWVTRDEALDLASGAWLPIVVRAAFDR